MAGRQNWRLGKKLTLSEREKLSVIQSKLKTRARKIIHIPSGKICDSILELSQYLNLSYHTLYSRIRRDKGVVFNVLKQ